MDDVEPAGGVPGDGNGVLHVARDVSVVAGAPQAGFDGRDQLVGDVRITCRYQAHLVPARVELLTQDGDHALRAGIRGRRHGQHRGRRKQDLESI
jgi:hypothetical protein